MTLGLLLGMIALLPRPVADQTCLAATVYMEARSQPTRGQLAVAEVALDRLDMGRYGNTICDVVTSPHQFALTTTSKNFEIDNPVAWNKAWKIAGQAIDLESAGRGPQAGGAARQSLHPAGLHRHMGEEPRRDDRRSRVLRGRLMRQSG